MNVINVHVQYQISQTIENLVQIETKAGLLSDFFLFNIGIICHFVVKDSDTTNVRHMPTFCMYLLWSMRTCRDASVYVSVEH